MVAGMMITSRAFTEKWALLECGQGNFFHIPTTSRYIPHVGQKFVEIDNGVYAVILLCPICGQETERHVYGIISDISPELKEL